MKTDLHIAGQELQSSLSARFSVLHQAQQD